MRSALCLLMLVLSAFRLAAAQTIDLVFTYGRVDYVPLTTPAFGATTGFTFAPKNLNSFAVTYRGWSLVGEYVYVAGFYYELNPHTLQGANRSVDFDKISKYPDLVKRYNAIRPSRVDIVLTANVETESGTRPLRFKITDNDLVYFGSRSGENYTTPGSPPRWKDAVSFDDGRFAFTANDTTTDEALKKFLAGLKKVSEFNSTTGDVDLMIKWPDAEIDRIAELFDQYEKEEQTLAADYAYLEDAPRENRYAGSPAEAKPHDFRLQPGETFADGAAVGLRVNGREVFRSSNHKPGTALDAGKTYFTFPALDGSGLEVIDTKGKAVKIDGSTRLAWVEAMGPRGPSVVVSSPRNLSEVVYVTQGIHSAGFWSLTQKEFDKLKAEDRPARERNTKGEEGTVFIVFPYYRQEFRRYEVLELDAKLNVIGREWRYRSTNIESSKVYR